MATSTPPGSSEDRIIGATLALINQRGLGGITMSGIAEAAGVARQTLYNHYPDIDSIVATAITRHNRESIELLESALATADSPEDKLDQLVRHVAVVGAHAGHSLDVQYGLSSDSRAALSEYGELMSGHIQDLLNAGIKSGAFRSDLVVEWHGVLIQHLLSGISALAAHSPTAAARIATTGYRTILACLLPG